MAVFCTILVLLTVLCQGSARWLHPLGLRVTAPAGRFQGTVLTSPQGRKFKAFLGIPYAQPPIGDLRFAKPEPLPRIRGTFQATRNPPMCIQISGVDFGSPISEDCLYLSVYTPLSDTRGTYPSYYRYRSSPLKKVFVYIHGDTLNEGSANEQVPGDLVVRGDVIVVTLNYRLSWLGFVKGNTPEVPGNMGFWDQLLALKWVKANIRSFGGDPGDITIGGHSSGAYSVSVLAISPQAKDLFTKAVLLSASAFINAATPGSSDHLLYDLADIVGCDYSSRNQSEANNVVECLRQLPAEAFSLPYDPQHTYAFLSIDGDLLPAPVSQLISDQDYLTEVGFYSRDYISSVVSNEAGILFQGRFAIGTEDLAITPEFLQNLTSFPLPLAETITSWYQEPGNYRYSPANELYSDLVFRLPVIAFLETFASVQRETFSGQLGNSYLIEFDFTPSYNPEGYQGFLHGLELAYLFDISPRLILGDLYYQLPTDTGFTDEDRKLKNGFIDALTEFMKTGNPGDSLSNGMTLPTFDLDTEIYLRVTPEPMIQQFPFTEMRDFWRSLLS